MNIINFSRFLHRTKAFKNYILKQKKKKKSLEPRSQDKVVVIYGEIFIVKTTSFTQHVCHITFHIFNLTPISLDQAEIMVKFY